jgi:hypothetical protein
VVGAVTPSTYSEHNCSTLHRDTERLTWDWGTKTAIPAGGVDFSSPNATAPGLVALASGSLPLRTMWEGCRFPMERGLCAEAPTTLAPAEEHASSLAWPPLVQVAQSRHDLTVTHGGCKRRDAQRVLVVERRAVTGAREPVRSLAWERCPNPGPEDAAAIRRAFGRRRGKLLTELHGVVRDRGESIAAFNKRAARRYVQELIRSDDGDALRVAITGGREPVGTHDLSLDWRRLLDEEGRAIDATVIPTLVETLADIREAAQAKFEIPHIVVEPHLRLPLSALVGWEWNRVRPVRLSVVQPSPRGS